MLATDQHLADASKSLSTPILYGNVSQLAMVLGIKMKIHYPDHRLVKAPTNQDPLYGGRCTACLSVLNTDERYLSGLLSWKFHRRNLARDYQSSEFDKDQLL